MEFQSEKLKHYEDGWWGVYTTMWRYLMPLKCLLKMVNFSFCMYFMTIKNPFREGTVWEWRCLLTEAISTVENRTESIASFSALNSRNASVWFVKGRWETKMILCRVPASSSSLGWGREDYSGATFPTVSILSLWMSLYTSAWLSAPFQRLLWENTGSKIAIHPRGSSLCGRATAL